ncbi:MAG: glycosyltransferase family 4 protein [bacterium]
MKIKVLQLITRLNVGGPSIHVILLTKDLNKERFESFLISGQEDLSEGNMLDLLEEKEIKPIIISEIGREINWHDDFISLWKLWKYIKKIKPDIIHTHMAKIGTLGRISGILAGVPIIIHTFHGHTFHSYFSPLKNQLFIFIEKILAFFTTKIIAITKSQKDEILKHGIGNPKKIVMIPLGFDLEKFLNCDKEKGKFRQELNFNENDFLIGIIARLVPIKGHSYFLKAASIIAKKYPQAKFLIIGDGKLRPSLEKLAQELGIISQTFFLGFKKDMDKIYADLDLVVISSLNEGSPVSIIEAMAAAKAIVSTNVGGVPDLIKNNETGVLVPSKNPDALAQEIIALLENPDKRKKMGILAKENATYQFSKENLIKNTENLYNELVSNLKINKG